MDLNINKIIETDVLVIGGGGAAARAAVAAHDEGAKTILAVKGRFGYSGATMSPDSNGVAWQVADDCSSSEDSPEAHCQNIIDAGLGLADPALARILAYDIVDRTKEMEAWGMQFVPDPENKKAHYSGYSCFGTYPRAHGIANSGYGHAGDIVITLKKQILKRGIEIHEEVFISDLIIKDQQCIGALAINPDGKIIAYHAGAVVIGAGGARQVYATTKGKAPIDTSGDGYAMALRSGAELTNMEFTQYSMLRLDSHRLKAPGICWALFPQIKNKHGEDALTPYLPSGVTAEEVLWDRTLHYPFSCRDSSKWLDIALTKEIRAGKAYEDNSFRADFSNFDPKKFTPARAQHMPQDYNQPVILPDDNMLNIRPSAHANNGGILINEQAASNIPGIFAAGESATGAHGADRLGGASVTACQVFGARAGKYAAQFASDLTKGSIHSGNLDAAKQRLASFNKGDKKAEEILKLLHEATRDYLIVTKDEKTLLKLIARVEELSSDLPQVQINNSKELIKAMEVDNALLTADIMARAALARKESRGGHYREDYPGIDEQNWRSNIIFRQDSSRLKVIKRSLETSLKKDEEIIE